MRKMQIAVFLMVAFGLLLSGIDASTDSMCQHWSHVNLRIIYVLPACKLYRIVKYVKITQNSQS